LLKAYNLTYRFRAAINLSHINSVPQLTFYGWITTLSGLI
jgi:hypothetical protein